MPAVSDAVWSEQGTTPDAIEAALRELLAERHSENGGFLPARVLNMVAFVESEWSGEIANRLRGVGRYHASRLVVLSYEPKRTRLDAHASVAAEGEAKPGELVLLHETVIVELGDRHLDDLLTIADPLVVSDLPTLLWSPHGHPEAVEALLPLAQATLLDSVDEPVWHEAIDRANTLSEPRLRRRSRLAAVHPLARADRGHLRPTGAARGARDDRRDHGPPPSRLDRRGDAADRLAGFAPGLAADPAGLPR